MDQQGFEPPPAVCQRWQDQPYHASRVAPIDHSQRLKRGAPDAFTQAITTQDKQNHPVIAQMIRPGISDDPPPHGEDSHPPEDTAPRRLSTHPSTAANSLPISARCNVRFSRLPLTENRHWCYIDQRHRCYR